MNVSLGASVESSASSYRWDDDSRLTGTGTVKEAASS